MKMKLLVVLFSILALGGVAVATTLISTTHTHDEPFDFDIKNEHSGRTDSKGGHNCSESSKKKGLCTGYHYH